MTDRSNRHSQTLTNTKTLEVAKVIRRECSNVSSRPGRQITFHIEAGYMYATTLPYRRVNPLAAGGGTIYVWRD